MTRQRNQRHQPDAEGTVTVGLPGEQQPIGMRQTRQGIRREIEYRATGVRLEGDQQCTEYEIVGLALRVVAQHLRRALTQIRIGGDDPLPAGSVFGVSEGARSQALARLDRNGHDELREQHKGRQRVDGQRIKSHDAGVLSAEPPGLNDSGEMLFTRIVAGGAAHVARGARTLPHAHYAWKIVVGLDAPVWFRSGSAGIAVSDAVRALVVPPGLLHQVGAPGWSCTLFSAPGQRNTPWHVSDRHWALDPAGTKRVIAVCEKLLSQPRLATTSLVDEVFRLVFSEFPRNPVDSRVRRALGQVASEPNETFERLSGALNLSTDRLSHLVKQTTGMALRKHVVWSRLMALLSKADTHTSIASAAAAAGFADHAHLTRTYRSYLGRLPSHFSGPPDVLLPW